MKNDSRLQVRWPKELEPILQDAADARNISVSAYVRGAVAERLRLELKEKPPTLKETTP